jgi:hypothetical protein
VRQLKFASAPVVAQLPRWLADDLAEAFREVKLVGKPGPLRDGLERQDMILWDSIAAFFQGYINRPLPS